MATPKFDRIAISFLHKAKGEFSTTFTPGSLMPDADFLTAEQISDYVNRALITFFNQSLKAVGFDDYKFASQFPEMVGTDSKTLTGKDDFDVSNKNLYRIIAFRESRQVNNGEWRKGIVFDMNVYGEAKSGQNHLLSGDNDEFIGIRDGNILHIFPGESAGEQYEVEVDFIIKPLDLGGGDIIQNGKYDVPYSDIWLEEISDIAYQLYLKDADIIS